MRVYVHEPDADLVLREDVKDTQTFRGICTAEEADFVFLDNDDEPVDVDVTIVETVVARGRTPGHHHVHRHHCRQITIDVHYGGETRPLHVTPNQTVATVLSKAIAEYGIDAAAGADLVLRQPGSNEDLPQSDHVGDLHVGPSCKIELNLLPAHREAG